MVILILLLLQTTLPLYEISVDPALLPLLDEDIEAKIEIPATIVCDGISGDCTIAYRGGTSLNLVKKSWHIRINDPELLPGGGHILLNAQYRDPSLMRNTLGLFITRELGLPAPETEFVTLSINGEFQGVYERVERVDRLFFERNGLSYGPVFKNTDTMGRLAPHFADTSSIAGLEPKIDSEPYSTQVLQLISSCIENDVSSLETDEVLAAFAVHSSIYDNDGIIKNFYLHKVENCWHYYPWDRDATFGNTWEGEYIPDWFTYSRTADIGYFGASNALFASQTNIQTFNYYMQQTTDIMENKLPEMVDSIRLLIRDDLALDPYYLYSSSQFDSLCLVLSSDIEERVDYLQGKTYDYPAFERDEIVIPASLDMETDFTLTVSYHKPILPYGVVVMISIDGGDPEWHSMQPSSNRTIWTYVVSLPENTYSSHFAFAPFEADNNLLLWYPSWSMRAYPTRPLPTPSARVALANTIPEQLSINAPVWCGENLWVLPITNQSSEVQDLSLCSFSLGESPSGYVFFAESTLVSPDETFYLTNFAENARYIYPSSNIYGDAGTIFPAETDMQMYNPAWDSIYSWHLSAGDSLPELSGEVIPSEVYSGNQGDWIELFNYSNDPINLSHYYLKDQNQNISLFPEGISIPGMGLILLAENTDNFTSLDCPVIPLELGFNSTADSLTLYSLNSDLIFSLHWNNLWPLDSSDLMYLINPGLSYSNINNWLGEPYPGTPGLINPGWNLSDNYSEIYLVSNNPNNGSFSFYYRTSSQAAEVLLYDLSGRVVSKLNLPEGFENQINADFSKELSNGVYFLYLRTSSGSASTRFTVLH